MSTAVAVATCTEHEDDGVSVTYTGDECPLCKAQEDRDSLQDQIDELGQEDVTDAFEDALSSLSARNLIDVLTPQLTRALLLGDRKIESVLR